MIVNVLQVLLGVVLAGLTTYLLILTRSRETLGEPDASDTVHGLLIAAAVLGVPVVVMLIAAWGLWKRRFWGWALSLATDVGMLAVFLYDIVVEHDHDSDEITMALGFVVPAILLLLPGVRKFYGSSAATLGSTTELS
jgi:uncharacterized membrane protein (DUF2068 family)